MIKFCRCLLLHPVTQNILLYAGFVAFLITWPVANIIIKNDSFRDIGNWSTAAYVVFIFVYALFPIFLLTSLNYLIGKRSKKYVFSFQHFLFVVGAGIFWMQLAEYHLVPILRAAGFVTNQLRYYGMYFLLFSTGVFFMFGIYKLRKYMPIFFVYISPLMFVALGLVFFTTIQTKTFSYSYTDAGNEDKDSIFQSQVLNNKNIYLLIFDSIPLPRLIKNGEIDKKNFPTFYRLSKEWTWYRNATTNGTSTSTVRPMLFSGRYYNKKICH